MLYEQDMNEEAYHNGSGTVWDLELWMRSTSVWDMTVSPL
jgi:hypothetical protein